MPHLPSPIPILILLILTTSFPIPILASPKPPSSFRCGTTETHETLEAISQVLYLNFPSSPLPQKRIPTDTVTPELSLSFESSTNFSSFAEVNIDTWLHVVAEDVIPKEGWITDEQVDAQMEELNLNFAPQKFKFNLKGVTRTVNPRWANDLWGAEYQMKKTLRKGDYKTLNIYIQKYLRSGAFGFAQFPGNFTGSSRASILDGINVRYDTVPGGSFLGYNLGRTVTHEVGHWLGLLHTFSGYSCDESNRGDLIADTPLQDWPTSGCPKGLDSCPNSPGLDPIHNYMDYSADPCYTEFTPLQTKRMHDIYHLFRLPPTCSADNCLRALRARTIPGRLAESIDFCREFTKVIVSEVLFVKGYLVAGGACGGGVGNGGTGTGTVDEVVRRVSSACSCLPGVVETGLGLPGPL